MSYRLEYISTFHYDVQTVADFLAEYPSKAARIICKKDSKILNKQKG